MASTSDGHDRSPVLEPQADVLCATVVEYADAPDECTVYPAGATGDALVTRWITAREGSFVALRGMR